MRKDCGTFKDESKRDTIVTPIYKDVQRTDTSIEFTRAIEQKNIL